MPLIYKICKEIPKSKNFWIGFSYMIVIFTIKSKINKNKIITKWLSIKK